MATHFFARGIHEAADQLRSPDSEPLPAEFSYVSVEGLRLSRTNPAPLCPHWPQSFLSWWSVCLLGWTSSFGLAPWSASASIRSQEPEPFFAGVAKDFRRVLESVAYPSDPSSSLRRHHIRVFTSCTTDGRFAGAGRRPHLTGSQASMMVTTPVTTRVGAERPLARTLYFSMIQSVFSSVRHVIAPDALVVQLVGFADVAAQLPRFQASMAEEQGFEGMVWPPSSQAPDPPATYPTANGTREVHG